MGVAVVRSIDLRARGQNMASISSQDDERARQAWTQCIELVVGQIGAAFTYIPHQFNDLNRALAPGEAQGVLTLLFRNDNARDAAANVIRGVTPVIHFQSVSGEKLSTDNQFESLTRLS